MKIYLVGFMGSGKTTVGRELAARIDAPFFDLDELIEAADKMSIREMFAQKGEPYFRKRERDLLRSTRHLDSAVAAAEKPIDEDLLAEVIGAIGSDRRRHWRSGLLQNN